MKVLESMVDSTRFLGTFLLHKMLLIKVNFSFSFKKCSQKCPYGKNCQKRLTWYIFVKNDWHKMTADIFVFRTFKKWMSFTYEVRGIVSFTVSCNVVGLFDIWYEKRHQRMSEMFILFHSWTRRYPHYLGCFWWLALLQIKTKKELLNRVSDNIKTR